MKNINLKTGLKIFDLFVITILPTSFIAIAMVGISEHFFKIDFLKHINDKTISLFIIIFIVGSFLATLHIHSKYITPVYKIKGWINQFNSGVYAIPLIKTDLTVFSEIIHEIEKLQNIAFQEEKPSDNPQYTQSGLIILEDVVSKQRTSNQSEAPIQDNQSTIKNHTIQNNTACENFKDNKQEIYQKIIKTQESLDAMFKNLEGVLYAANHNDGSLTPLKPLFQNSKNNIDLTESIQSTIENLSKKITSIKETVHEAQIISINASLDESAELEGYGEQIKNVIDSYQAELDILKDNLTTLHKISETLSDGISSSDDLLNKTLANYQGLNIPVNNIKALKLQLSHVLQNINGIATEFFETPTDLSNRATTFK